MKKFTKISLGSLAALATVVFVSSFVAAQSENSVCIEYLDSTPLNLSLSASQLDSFHDILPGGSAKELELSWNRFRRQASICDYGIAFTVDGFQFVCGKDYAGDYYIISGSVEGLGSHKAKIRVGSKNDFIYWMDDIIFD